MVLKYFNRGRYATLDEALSAIKKELSALWDRVPPAVESVRGAEMQDYSPAIVPDTEYSGMWKLVLQYSSSDDGSADEAYVGCVNGREPFTFNHATKQFEGESFSVMYAPGGRTKYYAPLTTKVDAYGDGTFEVELNIGRSTYVPTLQVTRKANPSTGGHTYTRYVLGTVDKVGDVVDNLVQIHMAGPVNLANLDIYEGPFKLMYRRDSDNASRYFVRIVNSDQYNVDEFGNEPAIDKCPDMQLNLSYERVPCRPQEWVFSYDDVAEKEAISFWIHLHSPFPTEAEPHPAKTAKLMYTRGYGLPGVTTANDYYFAVGRLVANEFDRTCYGVQEYKYEYGPIPWYGQCYVSDEDM